jgi:hypothetical protein
MHTLTLEFIRKHPWYVLTCELPPDPSDSLLAAAVLAAWYCRETESLFALALRTGDYAPKLFDEPDEIAEIHEECERLRFAADRKIKEIYQFLEERMKEST